MISLRKIYNAKLGLTRDVVDLSQEEILNALAALGEAEYYINRECNPERLLTKSEWENATDTKLTPLPEFLSYVQEERHSKKQVGT